MGTSAEPVRLALRKLWSDHVIWTREYIVAAVAGSPDGEAAAGRLLKNQEDIGAAVVPYYGQAAGDKLTDLLKQHILIAVDLVAAAKSGDQEAFATHDGRWTANIGEIASFLAGANPNWPEKDVFDLLALDDSRIPERVASHDLVDALEDLLAGRAVRVPTTRPFGCSLDFV